MLQSKVAKYVNIQLRPMEVGIEARVNSKLQSVLENNNDQIDLLENLVKFLLANEGYYMYKVVEKDSLLLRAWYCSYSSEDKPLYKDITIDQLQKLGKYTTITISGTQYVLSKKNLNK